MEEPQENDRMLDSSSDSKVGGKPLKVNKQTSKEEKKGVSEKKKTDKHSVEIFKKTQGN
jgi:hypothetical protein